MELLDSTLKNNVLQSMIDILQEEKHQIIQANKKDLNLFNRDDQALYDRLIVDEAKVDDMIRSVRQVKEQDDPVSTIIDERTLDSGLRIVNKTNPFGTIMIIYESRPDVTIEAAVLAFKANNKILLKGGKEAYNSNKILVHCWHKALEANGLSSEWITMLEMDRHQTQAFLKNPDQSLDLIVPRGGEKLIHFVKQHASCAVLVSGRGNNFLYVSPHADWNKTLQVIHNAKTQKISACNALDKVLFDARVQEIDKKLNDLASMLSEEDIEILTDDHLQDHIDGSQTADDSIWDQEFLSRKIMLGQVQNIDQAIEMINEHSGHHSSVIMTEDNEEATQFMEQVDSAAVYQNASSRFTDGGAMGVGAELAISTDKLHHRGPLGLKQLVSNKYYVYGDGHTRS